MANYTTNQGHPLSRPLNCLALAGLCGVLLFAFVWQIHFDEPPCPLCLLQRAAFAMAGVGLLLNIRFGASSLHYGITVISALGGMFAAGRQILLHIAPGDAGFGGPFLGLHFYTWAFIAFAALIVFCSVALTFERFTQHYAPLPRAGFAAALVMWLFLLLTAANALSTTLECGFGPCPDDPTGYLWLSPGPGTK